MIQTNPQGLYSALLNPDTLKKIPDDTTGYAYAIENLFGGYLTLCVPFRNDLVILGTLITPFIGKITLSESPKRPKKLLKKHL